LSDPKSRLYTRPTSSSALRCIGSRCSGGALLMRFRCEPSLPVDVIGLFVLLAAPTLCARVSRQAHWPPIIRADGNHMVGVMQGGNESGTIDFKTGCPGRETLANPTPHQLHGEAVGTVRATGDHIVSFQGREGRGDVLNRKGGELCQLCL
jgi:hypothetical protein